MAGKPLSAGWIIAVLGVVLVIAGVLLYHAMTGGVQGSGRRRAELGFGPISSPQSPGAPRR